METWQLNKLALEAALTSNNMKFVLCALFCILAY